MLSGLVRQRLRRLVEMVRFPTDSHRMSPAEWEAERAGTGPGGQLTVGALRRTMSDVKIAVNHLYTAFVQRREDRFSKELLELVLSLASLSQVLQRLAPLPDALEAREMRATTMAEAELRGAPLSVSWPEDANVAREMGTLLDVARQGIESATSLRGAARFGEEVSNAVYRLAEWWGLGESSTGAAFFALADSFQFLAYVTEETFSRPVTALAEMVRFPSDLHRMSSGEWERERVPGEPVGLGPIRTALSAARIAVNHLYTAFVQGHYERFAKELETLLEALYEALLAIPGRPDTSFLARAWGAARQGFAAERKRDRPFRDPEELEQELVRLRFYAWNGFTNSDDIQQVVDRTYLVISRAYETSEGTPGDDILAFAFALESELEYIRFGRGRSRADESRKEPLREMIRRPSDPHRMSPAEWEAERRLPPADGEHFPLFVSNVRRLVAQVLADGNLLYTAVVQGDPHAFAEAAADVSEHLVHLIMDVALSMSFPTRLHRWVLAATRSLEFVARDLRGNSDQIRRLQLPGARELPEVLRSFRLAFEEGGAASGRREQITAILDLVRQVQASVPSGELIVFSDVARNLSTILGELGG